MIESYRVSIQTTPVASSTAADRLIKMIRLARHARCRLRAYRLIRSHGFTA
jgi:hypothetical protein